MQTFSAVIPVFNEADTIEELLKRVMAARVSGWKKEIIVVDDGSNDGTRQKLARWQKQVRLILQPKNQGKGAALRVGFAWARGDIVIIQDADLEYNPADYGLLLSPFVDPRVDIVYGSRFLGPHLSTMYFYALGNKFVTWLTNVLFNTNITDMETGYKAFRREILKKLKLSANRFDFEPEFTAQALKAGYQIYEVPISYYGRKFSQGKKLTWRDGVVALFTLLRQRFLT